MPYRTVTIKDVGFSGVACMQNMGNFEVACTVMAVGAVLQIIFVVFMCLHIEEDAHDDDTKDARFYVLACAAIFTNALVSGSHVLKGFKVWKSMGRTANKQILSRWRALPHIIVIWDGFVMPLTLALVGGLWLCTSSKIDDLILNATAVGFISQIDALLANGLDMALGSSTPLSKEAMKKNGFPDELVQFLVPEGIAAPCVIPAWNHIVLWDTDNIEVGVCWLVAFPLMVATVVLLVELRVHF